jgi:hypothetical protein
VTAPWNRPDLDTFIIGALYRESHADCVVEFVGAATVPELDGEDVAVFRFVDRDGGCLIATRHDYDHGQSFQPIQDEIGDDLGDL